MSLDALINRTYVTQFGNTGTIDLSPTGDSIQVYWSKVLRTDEAGEFNRWLLLVQGVSGVTVQNFNPPAVNVASLVPQSFYAPAVGEAGLQIQVSDGGSGTPWAAVSDSAWIHVLLPVGTVTGSQVVSYSVDAQLVPSPARSGNINITALGLVFPINQAQQTVWMQTTGAGGGGAVAGSDTQVQINKAGATYADAGFVYQYANRSVSLLNSTVNGAVSAVMSTSLVTDYIDVALTGYAGSRIKFLTGGPSAWQWNIGVESPNSDFWIYDAADLQTAYYVNTGNGFMGFGGGAVANLTTANYPFDFRSHNANNTQIHLSPDGTDVGLYMVASASGFNFSNGTYSGAQWYARQTSAHNLYVGAGGLQYAYKSGLTVGNTYTLTNLFVVTTAGSMGVGVASPAYAVDVAGDINCTGAVRINGTSITAGGGSQTPWTGNINAATFQLQNVGSVGSGFTGAPTYQMDIRGNSVATTQLHIAYSNADTGAYLFVGAGGGFNLTNGGSQTAGSWIAKATSSCSLSVAGGGIIFYCNTGLTVGNSFSQINMMQIVSSNGHVCIGNPVQADDTIHQVQINTSVAGQQPLQFSSINSYTQVSGYNYGNTSSLGVIYQCNSARGTKASPTAVSTGDYLFGIEGYGYLSSSFTQCSAIYTIVEAPFTGTTTPAAIVFWTAGTTSNISEKMRLTSTGNLGIGISNPTTQLQLGTDSASKPTTNTWTISSDVRLKKDIKPYKDGLEVLKKVKPIRYTYNGKSGLPKDEGIGIDAAASKDIIPDCISVYRGELDGMITNLYAFNSHALTFMLINAVRELSERLERLEKGG